MFNLLPVLQTQCALIQTQHWDALVRTWTVLSQGQLHNLNADYTFELKKVTTHDQIRITKITWSQNPIDIFKNCNGDYILVSFKSHKSKSNN